MRRSIRAAPLQPRREAHLDELVKPLAGVGSTGCRSVTDADVHAPAALREQPPVVGADGRIEIELDRVGDVLHPLVPSHDRVQGRAGARRRRQGARGAVADDRRIRLDRARRRPDADEPAVMADQLLDPDAFAEHGAPSRRLAGQQHVEVGARVDRRFVPAAQLDGLEVGATDPCRADRVRLSPDPAAPRPADRAQQAPRARVRCHTASGGGTCPVRAGEPRPLETAGDSWPPRNPRAPRPRRPPVSRSPVPDRLPSPMPERLGHSSTRRFSAALSRGPATAPAAKRRPSAAIRRRRAQWAASMFSSSQRNCRVPGIGTTKGRWLSTQARASCAGLQCSASASSFRRARAPGCGRCSRPGSAAFRAAGRRRRTPPASVIVPVRKPRPSGL